MNFKRLLPSLAVTAALGAVLISALASPASAEIGCETCGVTGMGSYAPGSGLSISQRELQLILGRELVVAPVSIPTYSQAPLLGLEDVAMPESPLKYAQAPVIPSRLGTLWSEGQDLPGAPHPVWDVRPTEYNPMFVTSFYTTQNGFLADPLTRDLSKDSALQSWGVRL